MKHKQAVLLAVLLVLVVALAGAYGALRSIMPGWRHRQKKRLSVWRMWAR